MGLGTLLFAAMLGGSAIKCGIKNANMMSTPHHYLKDGTPVYIDRLGKEYINGEQIEYRFDSKSKQLLGVGKNSGRIYIDPRRTMYDREYATDERNRQKSLAEGKLAYMEFCPERSKRLTCEISTGKYIALLKGDRKNGYRKFYLDLSDRYTTCLPARGDEGVPITMEEFDKLNINGGSHSAYDTYRDYRGRVPEDKDYDPRYGWIVGEFVRKHHKR